MTGSSNSRSKWGEVWLQLQKNRRIERFFYRHHRLFGCFVIACAAISLFILGSWHMSGTSGFRLFPSVFRVIEIAVLALVLAALCIGIFIVIRPSALKPLEEKANLWIEVTPSLNRLRYFLNRSVFSHPLQFALLVLFAAMVYLFA